MGGQAGTSWSARDTLRKTQQTVQGDGQGGRAESTGDLGLSSICFRKHQVLFFISPSDVIGHKPPIDVAKLIF